MCVCTHTQLPCGWFSHCVSCFAVFCTPVGKAGKGERSVVNDGAYDVFLKQVESMHAQGRASFEAEFNVSLSVVGLLFLLLIVVNSFLIMYANTCAHMRTNLHTNVYLYALSLLTRRQPHPLQVLNSTIVKTDTRTSFLVSVCVCVCVCARACAFVEFAGCLKK